MNLPFVLPPVPHNGEIPTWDGKIFSVGNELTNVLKYSINNQGWNDELTDFHESAAGDHHFIDRASRQQAIQQLKKHITQPNSTLLEIGCSSGFMLQKMHAAFPLATLMGADVVTQPLFELAKKLPNIPLVQFDLTTCPLPSNSFDGIVMLNVLEHIEHDKLALSQVFRLLKPGGILVLEVPAGPHLYDVYDKLLMHFRRYTLKQLRKLIQEVGFSVKKQSHLGFFIYPGFYMVKQKNKRFLKESEALQRHAVNENIRNTGSNKLFHWLMKTELLLGNLITYPFGIRCLMTCKKEK